MLIYSCNRYVTERMIDRMLYLRVFKYAAQKAQTVNSDETGLRSWVVSRELRRGSRAYFHTPRETVVT
jgi:hypothetical protein